jgi:hypothetical protein
MWRLSALKSNDMQSYETIRSMVVNEDKCGVINKFKSYLALIGMDGFSIL